MRQRPNILLIGDDAARMTQLRETLSRTALVAQAEDLQQALKRLARDDYETVLVDWSFHCGTWREALQSIEELYPDLPVIVISNSNGLGSRGGEWQEVVAAGAFDLLPAGCRKFEILSLVEHAVASAQARAMRAIA